MTGFERFGVTPETLLLTSKGYQPIGNLREQEVEFWNGEKFETSTVVKIAKDQKIVRVVTKNLMELECSENQHFITQPGLMPINLEIKEPAELEYGTKLPRIPLCPITQGGDKSFPHAYSHGFYTGMEKYRRERLKTSRAAIYGVRHPILEHLELDKSKTTSTSLMFVDTLPPDFDLPLDPTYSNATKLEWLAGFADGGMFKRKAKPVPIWLAYSDNPDFLYQLKLLLQTLGVDSTHTKNRDATSKHYTLVIRGKALEVLRDQGLPTVRTKFEDVHIKKNGPNGVRPTQINFVEDAYRTSDVYNFVKTKRKTAICNGMMISVN